MELVELIRGIAPRRDFRNLQGLYRKLGRTIAVSEIFRLYRHADLLPMINEAIYTLYEGVGNVEPSTPR